MTLDCLRGLRHLHQGDHSLLHSGSARAAEQNHRKPLPGSPFHHSGNFLSDNLSHAAHQEFRRHNANRGLLILNRPAAGNHRLIQPGRGLPSFHLGLVARKMKRITLSQSGIPFRKAVSVQNHGKPHMRRNPEIMAARGTDMIFRYNIFRI